jgi:hypothetical protein
MTKGLSFAVPYDPQFMFVIIITIIIKNWSCKARERERKTYLELLLKDEDNRDGGLANQCYFLPLYFCFLFTSPLFLLFSACFLSFFFFYISCSLCLSLLLFLFVSLCIICVCSFFVCVFLYYLFVVLPFFVAFLCSSWFLWVCIWLVGSTNYGEGKLKFPFAGGRSQVSLSSLSLCFSSPLPLCLCVLWFL